LQFSSQLQQLEAMGFVNRDQNIQALTLTGGNVEAAVDRILSGNFN
jgi:ubiquilin